MRRSLRRDLRPGCPAPSRVEGASGQVANGERRASAQLAFDQLKQDQTVAISYSERNGQRSAGLQVWIDPTRG